MNSLSFTDSRADVSTSLRNAIETSQPLSGGLWTPQNGSFPQVSLEELQALSGASYQDGAKAILGKFDWGIPPDEMSEIIESAYGEQWHHEDITPVKHIGGNMYSLHLGYGPTFAFKNVALEFLPRYLQAITKGKIIYVLGASSGDTINAAHHGVKGTNIRSIFMLPNTGPSQVQKLQATHGIVDNPNALTILAGCAFDPLQAVVKRINSPEFAEFKKQYNITSFNSINIARILAQVVYYFRAYTQLIKQGAITAGQEVTFSVPSGNFGDALACLYAREMGLPVKTINIATNENAMLHTFLETGRYEPPKHDGVDFVQVTNAPSQDIAKSSNFERALLWACNDPQKVATWYSDLAKNGFFEVDEPTIAKLRTVFTSTTSTDAQRLDTIRTMGEQYGHGIDPHTATGVYPILQGKFDTKTPVIFLETSHIAQFGSELTEQGIDVPGMHEFDGVLDAMRAQEPKEGVNFIYSTGEFSDVFASVKRILETLEKS